MKKNIEAVMRNAAITFRRSAEAGGSAGWLSDNYYILERTAKQAVQDCRRLRNTPKGSDLLPGLFARCKEMCENGNLPSEEEIVDMADFFKVFGDPTRLRILFVLWENEECNVGTISEKVKMSQSAVSQQLKILRSSRLVKFRKDGRSILYRLSDEHITKILQLGLEHYDELLG